MCVQNRTLNRLPPSTSNVRTQSFCSMILMCTKF